MAITLEELTLAETFIYIIIGWILIAVWQRFTENFAYNGLGLDREWPYHNFIVALVVTAIFFVLLVAANTIVRLDVFGVTGVFDIDPPSSPFDNDDIPEDLFERGSVTPVNQYNIVPLTGISV